MTRFSLWITPSSSSSRSRASASNLRTGRSAPAPQFVQRCGGYQATGVDPEAPPGPSYRQVLFEHYAVPGPLDAIVACTSLHHVANLSAMLDLVTQALVPGGRAVIVEWARERFDEATARWCFARLPGPDDDPG
jgi:SAM-dependent methyltransferase